jgi:hypothetical protein
MDPKTAHSTSTSGPTPGRAALARDPLSTDDILAGFYRPERRSDHPAWTAPAEADVKAEAEPTPARPRPTHYKVVCISLYNEDIERLESLVAELKRRGHTKANKSQVIREALLQIDLDQVPRHH